MVLTQSQKQANSSWWKMCMNNTREGGEVIWMDMRHKYILRGETLIAPNMKAYRDMMKNTTKEFFETHIRKPE